MEFFEPYAFMFQKNVASLHPRKWEPLNNVFSLLILN